MTGPDRAGLAAWHFTRFCLWRAGARALRVTPSRPTELDTLDGLVIGGGADVSWPPAHSWTDATGPGTRRKIPPFIRPLDEAIALFVVFLRSLTGLRSRRFDEARDELELALLEGARAASLPVLGICRGAQLMNLAEGGTLLWNLKTLYVERPELRTVLPRRHVEIAEGTKLRRILGSSSLLVNSLHQHAVGEPGRGVRVVARERTGVAQAIEHVERAFWIGVQWHPEYLPQHARHQRLFRALVECADRAGVERRGRDPGRGGRGAGA